MDTKLEYPFFTIGLDIGGTKIAGGILKYVKKNQAPDLIYKEKISSEAKKGPKILIKNICSIITNLKTKAKEIDDNLKIVAVGMGCAGRINKFSGNVMATTDSFPDFAGTKLCKIISEKTCLPAFALNDVQSHTYGEACWGAGKGIDNFVLLAVGTGIGGAVVSNGKLVMGSRGYAGELGHVQANLAKNFICTCGKNGHLESVAAGSGIERVYKTKSGNKLSGPEITKLANEGDTDALYALELSGECLGEIIAMYLTIFDPEIIILSGSVSKAGKIWKDAVMMGYKKEIIPELENNLNLCDAKLGDDAAIVGACEYALDRLGLKYE